MSKLPIHISRRDLPWRSMGAIELDNAPNAAPSVETEVIDEPIATRIDLQKVPRPLLRGRVIRPASTIPIPSIGSG
jgi:hypothetical protein